MKIEPTLLKKKSLRQSFCAQLIYWNWIMSAEEKSARMNINWIFLKSFQQWALGKDFDA